MTNLTAMPAVSRFIGLGSLAAGATFLTKRIGAGVAAIQAARAEAQAQKAMADLVSWDERNLPELAGCHNHNHCHGGSFSGMCEGCPDYGTTYSLGYTSGVFGVAEEPIAAGSMITIDPLNGRVRRAEP